MNLNYEIHRFREVANRTTDRDVKAMAEFVLKLALRVQKVEHDAKQAHSKAGTYWRLAQERRRYGSIPGRVS